MNNEARESQQQKEMKKVSNGAGPSAHTFLSISFAFTLIYDLMEKEKIDQETYGQNEMASREGGGRGKE